MRCAPLKMRAAASNHCASYCSALQCRTDDSKRSENCPIVMRPVRILRLLSEPVSGKNSSLIMLLGLPNEKVQRPAQPVRCNALLGSVVLPKATLIVRKSSARFGRDQED